jgi:N-acetylglucosamine-6-phosphate deacetylase
MLASLIPVSRLIATSDASPAAGLPPGRYNVLGNDVVLEPNGRLHNPEKQCLVGSSATLSECVEVLRGLHCFTEEQLESITWENPMNLIGLFS